ncbi:hypothetical protein ES703_59142 [subsurface metagenome]
MVPYQVGIVPALFGHRQGQFESHTAPAQVLERIGAVRLLGIKYGGSGGQFGVGNMVIGDDHINALVPGPLHLLQGADAAVTGDQQVSADEGRIVYTAPGEAIAFRIPVGNVSGYPGTDGF